MIKITNDSPAACDVDGTLVSWEPIPGVDAIEFNNYGCIEYLYPIKRHIDLIKKNHARGKFVMVWSQNGVEWCEEVIKKLGLEKYVGGIMTKPDIYIDDLDANAWMKRIFLG